jgi:hypothetical protein
MGKNLSYAGHLELIRSVMHGMVQFWLSIFPILGIVLTRSIASVVAFSGPGTLVRLTLLFSPGKRCVFPNMKVP